MNKPCYRFTAESKELVVGDQFSYEGGRVSELGCVSGVLRLFYMNNTVYLSNFKTLFCIPLNL